MLKKVFGKNVRFYRFQRNLTQEKLAELTDLSSRYISNIENGTGNVSLDTIEIIADVLEVNYSDLFSLDTKEIKERKVNMKKVEV